MGNSSKHPWIKGNLCGPLYSTDIAPICAMFHVTWKNCLLPYIGFWFTWRYWRSELELKAPELGSPAGVHRRPVCRTQLSCRVVSVLLSPDNLALCSEEAAPGCHHLLDQQTIGASPVGALQLSLSRFSLTSKANTLSKLGSLKISFQGLRQ